MSSLSSPQPSENSDGVVTLDIMEQSLSLDLTKLKGPIENLFIQVAVLYRDAASSTVQKAEITTDIRNTGESLIFAIVFSLKAALFIQIISEDAFKLCQAIEEKKFKTKQDLEQWAVTTYKLAGWASRDANAELEKFRDIRVKIFTIQANVQQPGTVWLSQQDMEALLQIERTVEAVIKHWNYTIYDLEYIDTTAGLVVGDPLRLQAIKTTWRDVWGRCSEYRGEIDRIIDKQLAQNHPKSLIDRLKEIRTLKTYVKDVADEVKDVAGEVNGEVTGVASEVKDVAGEDNGVAGKVKDVVDEVKDAVDEVKDVAGEVKDMAGEVKDADGDSAARGDKKTD